jgi:hypothetical protein
MIPKARFFGYACGLSRGAHVSIGITSSEASYIVQSRKEIDLEVVQIGMLITVFEVGHAMQTQASQTLAGCIALLRILGLDSRKSKHSGLMEIVEWTKVSMLMLDR